MRQWCLIFGAGFLALGGSSCKTTERQVRQASVDQLAAADAAIDHRGSHEIPTESDLRARQRELIRRQEQQGSDPRVGTALIRVTTRLGELDRGRRYCRQVLTRSPNARQARIACAELEMVAGELELAEIMLNRLGDGRNDQERAEIFGVRALIAMNRGDDQEATAFLQRALQANPEDVQTMMNLGLVLLRYRHFSAAGEQFRAVLQRAPNHVAANLHLAVVQSVLGVDSDVEELTERATRGRQETRWMAIYNLAINKQQQDDFEGVAEALGRLLQMTDRRHPQRQSLEQWQARNERKLMEQRAREGGKQDV